MLRKAVIDDIKPMKKIIDNYAKKELMLPRSLSELYESIRDFYVYEENNEIIGCCALHVVWEDLAEILSLAVIAEHNKRKIGTSLLKACIDEGYTLGVKKVFTLSYVPEFFEKNGFEKVDKSTLPHKVWSGCIKCPKFPECEEIALIRELEPARSDT
ncbi:GCN5-related N-acetyltransferase [Methanosalsum zhilinae DSM 4017]|uniref:GCN5-related N-acetyltransferase n=1 Tax=Methanosalsum zhilinae (strain DSM 4017 / NBRC 107636 / OCM 62 / WeN5) TaxID=679901 RepID=F7XL74_METZD|nr:N-acetyltransferase [Methanosalsum zhilinae]AEH60200.1 GCN5-related N-acetyltransferase [Methanosalsum zhilinae DSM 4017]